jgi:DNA-binding PucR family transcriptional regulator
MERFDRQLNLHSAFTSANFLTAAPLLHRLTNAQLDRQLGTAFEPASFDHIAASTGAHASAKTVFR